MESATKKYQTVPGGALVTVRVVNLISPLLMDFVTLQFLNVTTGTLLQCYAPNVLTDFS